MRTAADLALAKQHVAESEQLIADQEVRITRLEALGNDTGRAEALVRVLRDSLSRMRQCQEEIEAGMRSSGVKPN